MTDIDTLYETADAKDGTLVVTINGVVLQPVWRAQWRFDVGRVPSATIRVSNPTPLGVDYFDNVTIEAGFNGIVQRVFTGIVLDVRNDEGGCNIECVGKSWALDVPYQDILVALGEITSEAAIISLLDDAGILDYQVDVPAWTMGTVAPQTLRFATFGEAISKIAEVDGCHWYEIPSGQVIVRVVPPIPSLGISREYFSMQLTGLAESYPAGIVAGRPRLRKCQRRTRVRLTKNEVLVRGALVTEEIAPGVESSHDITALVQAPSNYVLNPDGSQAYNDLVFNNELIDTESKGDEVAARLLAEHNRLWVFVAATIDGDPRMALIETHRIEDPGYSGVTSTWFVNGYKTTFSQQDFMTTMDLRGGTGAVSNRDPIADFVWVLERQVIDDREYIVLTVDGRASFDPDGTIASYSWTDNQTPIVTGATSVVTVRADPDAITEPWEVTLTVTDNDGATNSVTKTIALACRDGAVLAFYTAFENNFSASVDGGKNWADNAGADVVSVAASPVSDGVAVYGTSAGTPYLTLNGNQTAPSVVLSGAGSEFKHIWWDTNDPARVWAVTEEARLYRSTDEGATWSLYADLRTELRPKRNWVANRIDTLSRAGSDVVRVFGGDGKGKLMIVSDIGLTTHWSFARIGGELQDDVGGSGPNDLIVFDAAFQDTGELAIILNSTTQTPSVYYTADVFGDGTAWRRATADPAKPQGRWIEPDLETGKFALAFNDTVIYNGDVAAGVMALSVAAAALDVGDAPNHGIWLGRATIGLAGVYVVSAEGTPDGILYKTWDRFASIGKLRPATGFPAVPAGANAKQTSIKAVAALCPELYAQEENADEVVARLDANTWVDLGIDPISLDNNWHLIRLGDNFYRINASGVNVAGGNGILERSADIDNNVWTTAIAKNMITDDGPRSVTIDARGYLWCGTSAPMTEPLRLFRSIDDGVTWHQIITGFEATGFPDQRIIVDIACDPNNPDVIVLAALTPVLPTGKVIVTTDGGSSWVERAGPSIVLADRTYWLKFAEGGRLVGASSIAVEVSDDLGVSWATKLVPGGGAARSAQALIGDPSNRRHLSYSVNETTHQFRVYISRDNGENWELTADAFTTPASGPGLVALGWAAGNQCWSAVFLEDGSLVIGSRPGEEVWRNPDPFRVPVPAWQDWSYNLPSIFPGAGALGQQSLASSRVQMEP